MDHLTQIAHDIFQVRLPLPFRLNHVQCYLVRDGNGWVIFDSGLNTSVARSVWQETFLHLKIDLARIHRIILTHTHPDHFGLAGWLQAESIAAGGSPDVFMSPREAALAKMVWQEFERHREGVVEWYVSAGAGEDFAEQIVGETKKTAERTTPHPQEFCLLTAGEKLEIGDRTFEVIHAPGHSEGQLLFYDRADQLLLSGDHVLMKITPHIGYWNSAETNPLAQFLTSLQSLETLDVRLALPGHRALITNWKNRLVELQQHHADRLQHTLESIHGAGSPLIEISQRVFRLNDLNIHEARFAIAETRSHVELLVEQGHVSKSKDAIPLYFSG